MGNEFFSTGMSSVSVSRNAKGDYVYEIKLYYSGKGKAPFAALGRIDEMRLELERRLGIAGDAERAREREGGKAGKGEEAEKRVDDALTSLGANITANAIKLLLASTRTPQSAKKGKPKGAEKGKARKPESGKAGEPKGADKGQEPAPEPAAKKKPQKPEEEPAAQKKPAEKSE